MPTRIFRDLLFCSLPCSFCVFTLWKRRCSFERN